MSTANSFISEPLAIGSLIVDRSRVLDLSRPDLVRRAGYKNIAKGLRRLDELLAGDLDKTRDLIRALPAALDVPPEVVEHAIEETRRRIAEAQEAARHAREAAWRAAFRPHAIILTERTVPQPIFVAAIIGVERLLRIDFDLALPPLSYASQALAGIRRRLSEFRSEFGQNPGRASWLRSANRGDRELHAGSRDPFRSRRQRARNPSTRTSPGRGLHSASRSATSAVMPVNSHRHGEGDYT